MNKNSHPINRTSKFRSIRIDRHLQQEHENRRRELQLLLIGSAHSGKNTISKQLRIHYGDGFPPNARLQLAPTILANLADSVILVLRNMTGLNIHFTDTSVKRLATRMLDAQPENGFISTILCSSKVSRSPSLFDWPKPRHDYSIPVNMFNASVKQPDISSNIETSFELDKTDNPLMHVSSTKNSLVNNDIANAIEPMKPKNQSNDDEQSCLEETLLRILQNSESVPPSLMKKFELLADSEILDELQQALLDTKQLRSLYMQLTRHKADGLPAGLLRNNPPPIPNTPPPLSFEDELLDCIVGQNPNRFSSSTESSSLSSTESGQPDKQTKVQVNHDYSKVRTNRKEEKLLKTCASETQPVRRNMECLDYEKVGCTNQTGENSVDHTLSLDISVGRLWPLGDAGSFQQFRMLRRILKIITEQSEFQMAMQKSKYFVPKISYADTYFIRHVDRIIQEDYIPTLQDILVMRQPSKAIRETLTLIGTTVVRTVDLAEQSHYLHKHLHYFESVDTVMFIVPLSNRLFSNQPSEAESELEASVRLFETIVTSPHMLKKDYVVFFNKLDLLRSEIEEASSDDIASVCEDRVATVVDNWKQRFFAFKHKPDSKDCRMISIYVICALDVDQMKSVMRDCLRGIFDLHRKRHVLL